MIKIKKQTRLFFKSFYISATLCLCLFIAVFGSFKAYENIRLIGFGEYKKAVEITPEKIRFFDFELTF